MELRRLFDELLAAAERAGIDVRLDAFDAQLSDVRKPGGGFCVVRGRPTIVVDRSLPLPERIATVAAALSRVDLEHLYLAPVVRATIGAYAPVATPAEPVPFKRPRLAEPPRRARGGPRRRPS